MLQLGLVLAWVLVTGIQGFAGSLTVGAARGRSPPTWCWCCPSGPSLGGLLAVFGVGFLAVVLQQMFRRPRPDLVASLSGSGAAARASSARWPRCCCSAASDGRARGGRWSRCWRSAPPWWSAHLVDLVLPRPQVADGVPRGLPGLVLAVAGRGGGRPTSGARASAARSSRVAAVVYGAVLGLVAALMAVAASYVVVAAHADDAPQGDAHAGEPRFSAWALPVIQVVLPLAACAPVALAMQTVL